MLLFGTVTAYPTVSAAAGLPDTGGFRCGRTVEISVNRTGRSCAGNWSGISISADGRCAGKVGQRTCRIGRNILRAKVSKVRRYRLGGKIRDDLGIALERIYRAPTGGATDAYGGAVERCGSGCRY